MTDDEALDDRDLILDFLQTFRAGDARLLTSYLDRSVTWSVAGQPALSGREAMRAFWGRLLPHYQSVRIVPRRLLIDGETRIADQVHVYRRAEKPPVVLENIAVYQVRDGRILSWSDNLDLSLAPEDEKAIWRRYWEVARAY